MARPIAFLAAMYVMAVALCVDWPPPGSDDGPESAQVSPAAASRHRWTGTVVHLDEDAGVVIDSEGNVSHLRCVFSFDVNENY